VSDCTEEAEVAAETESDECPSEVGCAMFTKNRDAVTLP
jgi:hypothetical protein